MAEPDVFWTGISGKRYGYWIQKLPFTFNPDQKGNYILARLFGRRWIPLYVGQGDLERSVHDPTNYNCAISKGATHVHNHTNPNKADRLLEERDLLAGNSDFYAPRGCNQRIAG